LLIPILIWCIEILRLLFFLYVQVMLPEAIAIVMAPTDPER
jgi:hypothetical protein